MERDHAKKYHNKKRSNKRRKISTIDFEMVKNASEIWIRFYETHVRSSNKKAIVAEEDGRVVGYLLGSIEKRSPIFKTTHIAFISDAGVTRERRNRGIGTKLVKEFVAWAKEKRMKYITLSVIPDNELEVKFWRKHGFKTILFHQRKIL
jgi:ribosomal protein S18 acetylase RimI-like enzyme